MRGPRIGPAVATLGLALVVLGTFLPWFSSGSVSRSSYAAAGLADRLALLEDPVAGTALRAWIAVPALTAVCVVLFVCGLARTAATLTALLAITGGTIALLATVQAGESSSVVAVSASGPVTTLCGSALALAGALGTFVTARAGRTR
ncbi:hypothetical protein GCM10027445_35940 [Amycolatopsis endophytica]|uniref:Threonine dehydrogenase-like Zn-dependent dehydrogenase n=1 Tax=Amycolatopsis endophytica TaxID=860233 RepID=A0A853BBM2_9PSEU|nr:hypothetical protein [Amycolatopsis endophytica]NYI92152.1 threonine dehydrogenase-like Zn-dependent dehydrogenase [Amycolatopsis endophytica]